MRTCVICKTRYQKESGITFHRFPPEPRLKLWLKTMNIVNWCPKKKDHICSKHFTENCFIRHEKCTTLKKCSIPTIFSDSTSNRVLAAASCTTSTDKGDLVVDQELVDYDTSCPPEYVALPKSENLGASAICTDNDPEVDLETMEGSTLLRPEYMELPKIECLRRDSSFLYSVQSSKKKGSEDSETENNNHERCESEKKNRTSVINCSVSMISKYDKRSAPAASVSSGSEWSEKISSSGEKYYYNRVSEVSQWEKPREWDSQRTLSKDSTYSSRSNEPEAVLPTIVNIIKSSVFLNSTSKQNFKCKTRGVTRRRFLKLKENFKNQKQ